MRRIIGEATAFAFVAVLRFPRNSPADARLRRLLRRHWRQRPYCLQRSAMMEAMKIDLSDEVVKLIVEALEHYYAYTRAAQRDSRYQELADRLKESASPEDAPVQRISPKRKR